MRNPLRSEAEAYRFLGVLVPEVRYRIRLG